MPKNIPEFYLSSEIEPSRVLIQPPNRLNFPDFATIPIRIYKGKWTFSDFSGPPLNSDGLYLRAQMELEDVLGHL